MGSVGRQRKERENIRIMDERFSRTKRLIGKDGLDRLRQAHVAVFGIGGVGGYVCEALVRSGIGCFDLIDMDRVSLSNLNRQIIATEKTIGRFKTEVMKERMLDINPAVLVNIRNTFFLPENEADFPFSSYDYVVDAVDTVTAKIALAVICAKAGIPVISSMGAGNKLDASAFRVADIYETKVCPLAKVMRRELKKRGIEKLKVVYSEEIPIVPMEEENQDRTSGSEEERPRRSVPGSIAFVPSAAGLIIAGEVVRDLAGIGRKV